MTDLVTRTGIKEFLAGRKYSPVIDVRTPKEFKWGHIPGAINIPLFSDDERAKVGTTYKKKGRDKAIILGFSIVGPTLASLLEEGIKVAGKEKELHIYCWRGGMRSESIAWLFSRTGISCNILDGGYKSYRSHLLEGLSGKMDLVVVGGYTGSGKTRILENLQEMGEQVIDLEKLANHRGSAFGGLGRGSQPSSEHFGNMLYEEFSVLDKSRRIFVEDESRAIGSLFMPDEFYNKIRSAPLVAVTPTTELRIPYLVDEYGGFEHELLEESVMKISKRLGSENSSAAIDLIRDGDIAGAISIVLGYYDKTYQYGLGKRDTDKVEIIECNTVDPEDNAKKILERVKRKRW